MILQKWMPPRRPNWSGAEQSAHGELVDAAIERVEKFNSQLNAVIPAAL